MVIRGDICLMASGRLKINETPGAYTLITIIHDIYQFRENAEAGIISSGHISLRYESSPVSGAGWYPGDRSR